MKAIRAHLLIISILSLQVFVIGIELTSNDQKADRSIRVVGPAVLMIYVPAGAFMMGSNKLPEAKPQHEKSVKSFWLSEAEITFAQYVTFLNDARPSVEERSKWIKDDQESKFSHIFYYFNKYECDPGWENQPVQNVSWLGAKAFCDFYGLRLPTEAEWEYAAGGPEHYPYPWGIEFDPEMCCSSLNNSGRTPPTMPIRSFDANDYGLYDMAGNVWEWCEDWFYPGYNLGEKQKLEEGEPMGKVLRGGSWLDDEKTVQVFVRQWGKPEDMKSYNGFRPAMDSHH